MSFLSLTCPSLQRPLENDCRTKGKVRTLSRRSGRVTLCSLRNGGSPPQEAKPRREGSRESRREETGGRTGNVGSREMKGGGGAGTGRGKERGPRSWNPEMTKTLLIQDVCTGEHPSLDIWERTFPDMRTPGLTSGWPAGWENGQRDPLEAGVPGHSSEGRRAAWEHVRTTLAFLRPEDLGGSRGTGRPWQKSGDVRYKSLGMVYFAWLLLPPCILMPLLGVPQSPCTQPAPPKGWPCESW